MSIVFFIFFEKVDNEPPIFLMVNTGGLLSLCMKGLTMDCDRIAMRFCTALL